MSAYLRDYLLWNTLDFINFNGNMEDDEKPQLPTSKESLDSLPVFSSVPKPHAPFLEFKSQTPSSQLPGIPPDSLSISSSSRTSSVSSPLTPNTIDPPGSMGPAIGATAGSNAFKNLSPVPGLSGQSLWEFLLELLNDRRYRSIITWTGKETEFKLTDRESVAREWGRRKNKPDMTYERMSRVLRYYYSKNILEKVPGQRFVYRFVVPPTSQLIASNTSKSDKKQEAKDDNQADKATGASQTQEDLHDEVHRAAAASTNQQNAISSQRDQNDLNRGTGVGYSLPSDSATELDSLLSLGMDSGDMDDVDFGDLDFLQVLDDL